MESPYVCVKESREREREILYKRVCVCVYLLSADRKLRVFGLASPGTFLYIASINAYLINTVVREKPAMISAAIFRETWVIIWPATRGAVIIQIWSSVLVAEFIPVNKHYNWSTWICLVLYMYIRVIISGKGSLCSVLHYMEDIWVPNNTVQR